MRSNLPYGHEVKWLNDVLTIGAQFEDYTASGNARFATHDIKLHSTLTAIIQEGDRAFSTKLASLESNALDKGDSVKGRQLVWVVHDRFRLNLDVRPPYC